MYTIDVGSFFLSRACCRDTYVFSFDDRFEMHDDVEVLKRCGLAVGLESGKCHGADLERALKLVGINLRPYIIGAYAYIHRVCFRQYMGVTTFLLLVGLWTGFSLVEKGSLTLLNCRIFFCYTVDK